MPHLNTERLLLRPFDLDDANDVHRLASQWEVADMIPIIPHPYPEDAAVQFINYLKDAEQKGKEIGFAIVRTSDNELIGQISILVNQGNFTGTLGYWMGVEHWGHGYATEACTRVIEFGFSELGLNRIQASAYVRNSASIRVLEKSGLKYEGTSRQSIFARGVFEDVASFGLIQSQYAK